MGRAQLGGARYDGSSDCPDCGRSRYVTTEGYVITCKRRGLRWLPPNAGAAIRRRA